MLPEAATATKGSHLGAQRLSILRILGKGAGLGFFFSGAAEAPGVLRAGARKPPTGG